MKKVLILSYFSPPSSFAGSFRIRGWLDHFYKFGYYPVLITRHWEAEDKDFTAITKFAGIETEVNEYYSIYRLPYRGTIRDRLIDRFGAKATWAGKFFSVFQVLGQNFMLRSIPYRNIYEFSRKYLKEHPDVRYIITSGRPFIHFWFAHLLNKEFEGVKWVADYRDAWNTDITIEESLPRKVQRFFEKSRELKWTKSASLVTTVSDGLCKELSQFLKREVFVVYNGFEPNDFNGSEFISSVSNQFLIIYNGTLYQGQPVNRFLKVFKIIALKFQGRINLKLVFAGTRPNTSVEAFIKENPELDIEITERIARNEIIRLQKSAQLLLMVGHEKQKGVVSSKIFEYFGIGKPVFLYPGDDDVLTRLLQETKGGFICNDEYESVSLLEKLVYEYLTTGKVAFEPEIEAIMKYTRENQTHNLASLLDKL